MTWIIIGLILLWMVMGWVSMILTAIRSKKYNISRNHTTINSKATQWNNSIRIEDIGPELAFGWIIGPIGFIVYGIWFLITYYNLRLIESGVGGIPRICIWSPKINFKEKE